MFYVTANFKHVTVVYSTPSSLTIWQELGHFMSHYSTFAQGLTHHIWGQVMVSPCLPASPC